ncbi:1365_t:CDS:2, partial [Funneliformis geosporum]
CDKKANGQSVEDDDDKEFENYDFSRDPSFVYDPDYDYGVFFEVDGVKGVNGVNGAKGVNGTEGPPIWEVRIDSSMNKRIDIDPPFRKLRTINNHRIVKEHSRSL